MNGRKAVQSNQDYLLNSDITDETNRRNVALGAALFPRGDSRSYRDRIPVLAEPRDSLLTNVWLGEGCQGGNHRTIPGRAVTVPGYLSGTPSAHAQGRRVGAVHRLLSLRYGMPSGVHLYRGWRVSG